MYNRCIRWSKIGVFGRSLVALGRGSTIGRRGCADVGQLPSPVPSVMCVTTIQLQTGRKPLERTACRAENRHHPARTLRVRRPARPVPPLCAITTSARVEKFLHEGQVRAILTSHHRPVGKCRFTATSLRFCRPEFTLIGFIAFPMGMLLRVWLRFPLLADG